MKLTKSRIDAFKYEGDGTSRDVRWDDAVSGLGLRIYPSGRKAFVLSFRVGGRKRLLTLGEFGTLTLDKARRKAVTEKGKVIEGKDPVQERRDKSRKALSPDARFGAVLEEFIKLYAKPRQRTWKETERTLRVNCADWLNRPISSITKPDAYDLLDGYIADDKGPTARVTLAWLKTLWRWAWKRDIVSVPLMDAVEIDFEREIRSRVYSDDELKALWRASEGLTAQDRAFVKLVALLGVRKNELAKMHRDELNDPERPTLWTIPHERTKSKKTAQRQRVYLVPLPPLAGRILKHLLNSDDDLLFPGRHEGKAFDPGTPFMLKVRKASGVSDWSPHPHRDTIATWLQNAGHDEYDRGLILNHAGSGTVTSDYSHGYSLNRKRELLEKWADHVATVVQPEGAVLLT